MLFLRTLPNIEIFIMFVITLYSCTAWCDIQINYYPSKNETQRDVIKLLLSKTITAKDASDAGEFIDAISSKPGKAPHITVNLDSVGGSVTAAITLGSLLRKHAAYAYVYGDANCYSSCVYILAGAPFRSVGGRVGIHRPYEPNDKAVSQEEQKIKYKKIGAQIVSYLDEMNVPKSLYTDSLFISPEHVKILTFNELRTYGLNVNDPYAEEARSTRDANELGISRMEYLERKTKANSICGKNKSTDDSLFSDMFKSINCENDVLKGVR